VLLVCVFGGCTAKSQDQPTRLKYTVSFEIDVPPGWQALRDLGMMRVAVVSPQEGATDSFQENVNVVLDGLPPGMTWEAYEQRSLAQMQQGMADFATVESGEVEVGAHSATRSIYEHTLNGRRLRVLNYTIREGDRVYVITGSAPADTFERYASTFDDVARSFTTE
jgi:hypothetical protein